MVNIKVELRTIGYMTKEQAESATKLFIAEGYVASIIKKRAKDDCNDDGKFFVKANKIIKVE